MATKMGVVPWANRGQTANSRQTAPEIHVGPRSRPAFPKTVQQPRQTVQVCSAASYTNISPMNLSRRHFFLGSLALPALAAEKPLGEQPNVLLILVHGLPAWILGCYGNREVRTRNIDRLAQTGTRFLNHYACEPVADRARAALLTGRTPMQFKDAGELTLERRRGGMGAAGGPSAGGAEAAKFLDAQSAAKPFFLTAGFAPYATLPDAGAYAQAKLETRSE